MRGAGWIRTHDGLGRQGGATPRASATCILRLVKGPQAAHPKRIAACGSSNKMAMASRWRLHTPSYFSHFFGIGAGLDRTCFLTGTVFGPGFGEVRTGRQVVPLSVFSGIAHHPLSWAGCPGWWNAEKNDIAITNNPLGSTIEKRMLPSGFEY